jgi:hypothetical protein
LISELQNRGVPFLIYPANSLSEGLLPLATAPWLTQTGSVADIIKALTLLLC